MTTAFASLEFRLPADEKLGTFARWLARWVDDAAAQRLEDAHIDATVGMFRHALGSLDACGFDDAVVARCDDHTLFVDLSNRPDDIEPLVASVLVSEALARPFQMLRIVLARNDASTRMLAVVVLRPGPRTAKPELHLEIVARPRAMSIRPGEGPIAFADRIGTFVEGSGLVEFGADFSAVVERLAGDLEQRLQCAPTRSEPVIRVVRPGPTEVGRFRHLGFGKYVRPPTYAAESRVRRRAPRDSPFETHWFDPYWPLAEWIALHRALDGGRWVVPVEVQGPKGDVLSRGVKLSASAFAGQIPASPAVVLHAQRLDVSASVPEVDGLDPAERGSAHTPGWGGDAH